MRFAWMLQIVFVLAAPSAIYAYRHRGDPPRAVGGAGLVLAVMYVGLFGLFVVGETFTDPGGWTALGLVASWLLPSVLLCLLAWRRPAIARPLLVGLVVAMAGLYLWSAVAPDAWRSFEDDTGPVRGVVTMALSAPLAVLARQYVRDAGWLLFTLGLMPFLVALTLRLVHDTGISLSLAILDAPLLLIAALLLISARLDHQTHDGTALRAPGPSTGPPHLAP